VSTDQSDVAEPELSSGEQLGDAAINENEIPDEGLAPPRKRRWPQGTHDQVTRQFVAFFILGLLSVLYLVSLGAFIFGGINQEGFVTAIAAISGPQTLAAAVIGFYYGKKGVEK
jgi:small-conductance mechanosensitive channel